MNSLFTIGIVLLVVGGGILIRDSFPLFGEQATAHYAPGMACGDVATGIAYLVQYGPDGKPLPIVIVIRPAPEAP